MHCPSRVTCTVPGQTGSDAISRVDARLRTALQRPFNGWSNLAAFLGEDGEPFELMDRFNTYLGCLAPVYARFEPESSLSPDGALSVRVRCMSASTDPPLRLLLASGGAAPPQRLELHRSPASDIWTATITLSRSVGSASLTLMLGNEVADEINLQPSASASLVPSSGASPQQTVLNPSGGKQSSASTGGIPLTLVGRLKHRAENNRLIAGIIICLLVLGGAASAIKNWRVIAQLFSPDPNAAVGSPATVLRRRAVGAPTNSESSSAVAPNHPIHKPDLRPEPTAARAPGESAPYALLRVPVHGEDALAFALFGSDSVICEASFSEGANAGNRWSLEGGSTPLVEVRRFATHLTTVDQIDDFVQRGQWVSSSKDTAIFVLPRDRLLDKDLRISLLVQIGTAQRHVNARGSFASKDESGWDVRLRLDRRGHIQQGDWRWAIKHSPSDLF